MFVEERPLYLSGAPIECLIESHLNVTTDIAGGAGVCILIIGADPVVRRSKLPPFCS